MADYHVGRVGEQIGPYRLTRLLGRGGFGEVYEAEHRLLHQQRALKLLVEHHFHDPKQRERFLREARTLAGLDHANILPVLEVDEAGHLLYLVMPLYQRGTLSDLLKQRATPLPLADVERFLSQICAALGYAHARGIAHLDLKPENLLLHEDGRLVLADFGLAHLLKQGRLEAGTSASWGTPYYMAPEQIRGEPEPRSDLYALGIILYQLLTMQRPFTGNTPEAVMMKQVQEAPPALQALYTKAPAVLEPVVQKALAKQPTDRYQTAEALLTDFRAAIGNSSMSAAMPASAPAAAPTILGAPTSPAPVAQPTIPAYMNMPQAAAVVCEIPLPHGGICGVTARGRCTTCGRAYCASHQAERFSHATSQTVEHANMCVHCAEADDAKRVKIQTKYRDAETYFDFRRGRTACKDLLTAGVPPVALHRIEKRRKPKKGLFGGGQYVEVEQVIKGRGWILGTFTWTTGDYLTALLDSSSGAELYNCSYAGLGLVRVRRVSEGYGVLDQQALGDFAAYMWGKEELIKAMQAVKGLAGLSS